jgi:hypothetical protein
MALALLSAALGAQVYYGTIRGTALDPTGAVVPNVKVTITNQATNVSTEFVTNNVGNYAAPNLIPGMYRVTATSPGFKKFTAEDVQLLAAADYRVDLRLETGDVQESVTVTEGAQLVETEVGTIAEVTENYVFTNMAINSTFRSIWRMLQITPAVSGNIYAGGTPGRDWTLQIDGVAAKDGWTGNAFGPVATFLDSYREFRVELVNANATSATMANVALVSESGTNELHGAAWLHYNAVGFQARNPFSPTRPSGPPQYRPNVMIGGPVYLGKLYDGRNRTFFHFSWQGLRGSNTPQVANLAVPSPAFRAGDFSSLPTPLRDPINGGVFPGNRIPANRISSVSRYYQETFYPLPNAGDNYRDTITFPNRSNQYTARVDHHFGTRNTLYGRFLSQYFDVNTWDGGTNPLIGERFQFRLQRHFVISDTHMFSPRVINEFRAGYARDNNRFRGPRRGVDVVEAAGLNLRDLNNAFAIPRVDIAGYSSLFQGNEGGSTWSNYIVQDTLNYTRGKHNFKFGFSIDNYNARLVSTSPSLLFGTYAFNGQFSGNPYADFLLGLMNTSSRSTSVSPVYPHKWNYGLFIQDDYKVTPRLSLNLGLRWDRLDPGTNVEQNLISTFYPAANAIVVPNQAALAKVHPGFAANVPILTSDQAGLNGEQLFYPDNNNFAPRFGFAWRPTALNDFVLRGGLGVYYVTMQPVVSDGGGSPFELNESFTNTIVNGVPDFAFPNPFPTRTFVLGGPSATGLDPYLRTPYTTQYNVTAEKEMWDMGLRFSYIGTLSRKNLFAQDLNQPVADTTPYAVKFARRPYPYLNAATMRINGGTHNYHAGIVQAERRLKQGLYYQTHLTWARMLGDSQSLTSEDAFNRRREYSNYANVPRWRFVTIMMGDLPFGRGRKFGSSWPKALDYVLGNWMLSGTYNYQTGQYFTVFYTGVDPSNTNRLTGRADRIKDGNLPKGERTLSRWFDTTAFVTPPAGIGRFGTSGNNVLEGPNLSIFHFGVGKDIPLSERLKMRLEMVSVNFLNHPNYGNPAGARATIGSPTFGNIFQLNGEDGSTRDFSLTVRVQF